MNSFLSIAIQLLELLFAVGCLGSLIVILLAGIEDVETVFSARDEEDRMSAAPPVKQ